MTFEVELVQDPLRLPGLEQEWNQLAEAAESCSLFSTFDFTRLAWRHFSGPEDRLALLIVRDRGRPQVIAPLRVTLEKTRGIPLRVLHFIGEWEGDCPGLVSVLEEREAWTCLSHFLRTQSWWDALCLPEQPPDGAFARPPLCDEAGFTLERSPDATRYKIVLDGCWQDYFNSRGRNTRRNFRQGIRKLQAAAGPICVENCGAPERLSRGLLRFIALEQSGWKAEAEIGVGKSSRQREFYRDLIQAFAARGQAVLYCMSAGRIDVSANIGIRFKRRLYGLQTVYNENFARCSPGMLLLALFIRSAFGSVDEIDMLAQRGSQPHKEVWATHSSATTRFVIYRKISRALPLLLARQVKHILGGQSKAA